MQDPLSQPHNHSGRTRLAPSPTGALHLGNARTFLVNWTLARRNRLQIRLRIDDLDGPRTRKGADAAAIEDLRWLGLDWDGEVQYQSARVERYEAAFRRLVDGGRTYACRCTRKQVLEMSTAIAPDGSAVYCGTCRAADLPRSRSGTAIRFRAPDRVLCFTDGLGEHHCYHMQREIGDFVIRKADGTFSYQLASALDDLEDQMTEIVRGQDLLASTARQITLLQALAGAPPLPRFIHLPLVVGSDGRKLAKRHGDTTLASLRQEGVSPGRIRALLARWSGMAPSSDEIGVEEWIDRFVLEKLPRHPIRYDDATDRPRPL